MDIKTYRAGSMQEALRLVRNDLGPDAAVLHTRELGGGILGWLVGGRRIEVTASATAMVPSRLPEDSTTLSAGTAGLDAGEDLTLPPAGIVDDGTTFRPANPRYDSPAHPESNVQSQLAELHAMVENLYRDNGTSPSHELPESLFALFTDLIDAEVSEELARELIDRVRPEVGESDDPVLIKSRLARMIEEDIHVCGPINAARGRRRIVALVGPTGVGKTTTIAKLAANFRLRDKRRVGLITVDTYRIAAVEQLRTYADIIDLPMEVVSTPREMRSAVERLSDMELILVDTAGRSPRDEVKIQELKSMLAEAQADEVHLVLSAAAGSQGLIKTADKFGEVGTTALVLTKLDEATGLGNVLPLLRESRLPLSYITNGQNVPDDIQAAQRQRLAAMVLGME